MQFPACTVSLPLLLPKFSIVALRRLTKNPSDLFVPYSPRRAAHTISQATPAHIAKHRSFYFSGATLMLALPGIMGDGRAPVMAARVCTRIQSVLVLARGMGASQCHRLLIFIRHYRMNALFAFLLNSNCFYTAVR